MSARSRMSWTVTASNPFSKMSDTTAPCSNSRVRRTRRSTFTVLVILLRSRTIRARLFACEQPAADWLLTLTRTPYQITDMMFVNEREFGNLERAALARKEQDMELDRPKNPAITYGTYPALALLTAAVVALTLRNNLNRSAIAALLAIAPVVVAVIVEWRSPLREEWRMTKASFVGRDLPFIVLTI